MAATLRGGPALPLLSCDAVVAALRARRREGSGHLTYHEGYHIGQMALIRKGLGLPGLVDA